MYHFQNLPDNARVWIYQSDRILTDNEVQVVTERIKSFVQEWTSHQRQVLADGAIVYNRFIILGADESAFKVSGCSIDSSVHFIESLEQELDLNLFDRLKVSYKENDEVKTCERNEFQQLVQTGSVNEDTIVYNNLVSTNKELSNMWEVPLKESWHRKVFAASA